jgi:hypothetical protein
LPPQQRATLIVDKSTFREASLPDELFEAAAVKLAARTAE